MRWLFLPTIALLVPAYAWGALRGGVRHPALAALPAAALLLAAPWLVPTHSPALRLLVGIWAVVTALRVADVAWDRYPTPTGALSARRFAVLWIIAPDLRFPTDRHDRIEAHRDGLRRMGRGALQGCGALVIGVIAGAVPQVHVWGPVQLLWSLFAVWFTLGCASNLSLGLAMWLGWMWVGEIFQNPPAAASPREFWSQRWNLVFHNLARRHLFIPLGGRRRLWRAGGAVFAFSALVHEYLVVAAVGHTELHMTAFFALHGVVTLAYTQLRRRRSGVPMMPHPLAVTLHFGWMWATSALFFAPLVDIFPPHSFAMF